MNTDELLRQVPGIPDTPHDDFLVNAEGLLGASDRKILRFLLKSALPGAPAELYTSVRTVGDVRHLLEQSAGTVPKLPAEDYVCRSVYMRPLMPGDHEHLYFAALEPSNSFRWRFRGQTPGFREFSETLHHGTLAQFAFAATVGDSLVAYCSAYQYDANAQHCAFAVQRLDFDSRYDTAVIEAVALFLNYLFATFQLRKVFADIPEYNFRAFGLVEGVFETEGEKRDYYWHAGRFWSEITISTSTEAWQRFAAGFFG